MSTHKLRAGTIVVVCLASLALGVAVAVVVETPRGIRLGRTRTQALTGTVLAYFDRMRLSEYLKENRTDLGGLEPGHCLIRLRANERIPLGAPDVSVIGYGRMYFVDPDGTVWSRTLP